MGRIAFLKKNLADKKKFISREDLFTEKNQKFNDNKYHFLMRCIAVKIHSIPVFIGIVPGNRVTLERHVSGHE
jgi:hypothetical protein